MIRTAYWQSVLALCGVTLFCLLMGGLPFFVGADFLPVFGGDSPKSGPRWDFARILCAGFFVMGLFFLARVLRLIVRPRSHPGIGPF